MRPVPKFKPLKPVSKPDLSLDQQLLQFKPDVKKNSCRFAEVGAIYESKNGEKRLVLAIDSDIGFICWRSPNGQKQNWVAFGSWLKWINSNEKKLGSWKPPEPVKKRTPDHSITFARRVKQSPDEEHPF